MSRFLLIVFSLLIVGALVFAGGEEEETPEALSPAIGTVLQPRGALEAWDRYPSGVSSFTRQRVTILDPALTYAVIDTARLGDPLFGDRYYVRLEPYPFQSNSPCSEFECWVYNGRTSADVPSNLISSSVATGASGGAATPNE